MLLLSYSLLFVTDFLILNYILVLYILEHILERNDMAETLYSQMKVAGLKLRKVPFKTSKPTDGCEVDTKWKVIVNQEIEIDE